MEFLDLQDLLDRGDPLDLQEWMLVTHFLLSLSIVTLKQRFLGIAKWQQLAEEKCYLGLILYMKLQSV